MTPIPRPSWLDSIRPSTPSARHRLQPAETPAETAYSVGSKQRNADRVDGPVKSGLDVGFSRLRNTLAGLAATLLLGGCGTPTACLANRYDAAPPQTRCISGIQLPGNILKDTDPMSGSSAPVTVAR